MKITLKALRVNANMKQEDVAKSIGVTTKTIQNWEGNVTYPTVPQLIALCELYKCQIADIFLPETLAKSE